MFIVLVLFSYRVGIVFVCFDLMLLVDWLGFGIYRYSFAFLLVLYGYCIGIVLVSYYYRVGIALVLSWFCLGMCVCSMLVADWLCIGEYR